MVAAPQKFGDSLTDTRLNAYVLTYGYAMDVAYRRAQLVRRRQKVKLEVISDWGRFWIVSDTGNESESLNVRR